MHIIQFRFVRYSFNKFLFNPFTRTFLLSIYVLVISACGGGSVSEETKPNLGQSVVTSEQALNEELESDPNNEGHQEAIPQDTESDPTLGLNPGILTSEPHSEPDIGLKTLAATLGLQIGSQIDPQYLISIPETHATYEQEYETFFLNEFGLMIPGNNFKWRQLQPKQGDYYFDDTDLILDYAEQHDVEVHGHTLVWGNPKSMPLWLKDEKWKQKELIDILVNHVSTVVTRYKGRVAAWDVVNEAFCDINNASADRCAIEDGELAGLDNSLWYKTIGPKFIEIALRVARTADPDAKLYINENGVEFLGTPKADKYYEFARDLVERNIPLDAVGFQMHTLIDIFDYMPPSIVKSRIAANFARFNELGLDIHITELDVRIADSENGPTSEDLEKQAQLFSIMLEACLEAQSCSTFNIWGFTDKHSWIPNGHPGYGHATILDDNYLPKPAFDALRATLEMHTPEEHPTSARLLQEVVIDGQVYSIYDNGAVYTYDVGLNEWKLVNHLYNAESYASAYQETDSIIYKAAGNRTLPTFGEKYEDFEQATTVKDFINLKRQWTSFNVVSPIIKTPKESNRLRDCIMVKICGFVDNRIDVSTDQYVSGINSMRFYAASPTPDIATSTSSLESSLTYFKNNEDLWFSGWFYVEQGMPYSIVNFENDHFTDSPGPRVVVKDGKLAVELKFADKPVYQQIVGTEVNFPSNQWVNVKVHLVLSDTEAGKIEVWQNNVKVIDSYGRTLPTYNSIISNWEVGITATDQETVMYVDDVVLSKDDISSFNWLHRWSEHLYDGSGTWGTSEFGYHMALRDSYWRADVYGSKDNMQREVEVITYLLQTQALADTGVFPFPADENNPEFGKDIAIIKRDCPTCFKDNWLYTLPGQLIETLYYDHGYALTTVARYYLRTENTDVLPAIRAAAEWIIDKSLSKNINYNSALIKGLSYAYLATGDNKYREYAKLLHVTGVLPGFLDSTGNLQAVALDAHNAQLEYHGFIVSGMIALLSTLEESDDLYELLAVHLTASLAYMAQVNLLEEGAYRKTWLGTNLQAWIELSQLRALNRNELKAVQHIVTLMESHIDEIANEADTYAYRKALFSYFPIGLISD